MTIVRRSRLLAAADPALIPVTAGVPGHAPATPARLRATRAADGVRLTWRSTGTSYAVYRLEGQHADVDRCELDDATRLVGTTRGTTWTDTGAKPGQGYAYVVTALDRAYRESDRTDPARVASGARASNGLVAGPDVPMVHDHR